MNPEPTLQELTKQIDDLKKEKKEQMVLATSLQERNKLLNEIAQLEAAKKSPSALKNFGRTFGRGLRKTGNALFGGISKLSSNLDKSSPEYGKFAGSMFSTPESPVGSYSKSSSPTQSTQRVNSISYSKPMKRKVKRKVVKGKPVKRKLKKKVKKRVKARRMVNNSQPKQQNLWDMP